MTSQSAPLMDRLKDIKALFFDMDGVLTNGQVIVMPDGELIRSMHVRDGFALKTMPRSGYVVAIISAGDSVGAVKRFEGFGVQHIRMSANPKIDHFHDICQKEGVQSHEVLYMGDDVADIECLKEAGISVCPANATIDVLPIVDYVTKHNGGEAAVREVAEMVMRAQNKWPY